MMGESYVGGNEEKVHFEKKAARKLSYYYIVLIWTCSILW